VTFDVSWGQDTSFREVIPVGLVTEAAMFNTTTSTESIQYGNGYLSIYVINQLTVPNSTAPNDITVNVFVSFPEIEFAQPTNRVVPRLRVTTGDIQSTTQSTVSSSPYIFKQSEEMSSEQMKTDSAPASAPLLDTFAKNECTHDAGNLVHFGERITSFRQLLKRYCLMESPVMPQQEGDFLARFYRPIYPVIPGYFSSAISFQSLAVALTSGNYYYGYLPMTTYSMLAFAGVRGGMRYLWDFDAALADGYTSIVSREDNQTYNPSYPQNDFVVQSNTTPAFTAAMQNFLTNQTGLSGTALTTTYVNNFLTFEVPFYSQYRFFPTRTRFLSSSSGTLQMYYSVTYKGLLNSGEPRYPQVYCAAAEDFQPLFYTGPPVLYYEPQSPSN
jgi:hypothetical protein